MTMNASVERQRKTRGSAEAWGTLENLLVSKDFIVAAEQEHKNPQIYIAIAYLRTKLTNCMKDCVCKTSLVKHAILKYKCLKMYFGDFSDLNVSNELNIYTYSVSLTYTV